MPTTHRIPTFGDTLRSNARDRPEGAALVCGDTRLTWAALDERVDQLAGSMAADGVGPGDRVLWLGQNCHRLFEVLLAAARLGAVLCPVNWRQSVAELTFVLDDAEAKVVVWQEREIGSIALAAREQSQAGRRARWLQHDGPGEDSEYEVYLAEGAPLTDPPAVDADDAVMMLYTAAFDGRPNGALLSHRAWLFQNQTTSWMMRSTPQDVCLCAGPMFHVGPLRHALSTFQLGGKNVMVPRVDAADLCRIVDKERCSVTFLETPTLSQMVEVNADGRFDLTCLWRLAGPPAWNEMVAFRPLPFRNGFGQTELAGIVTVADTQHPGVGGAGRPVPIAQAEILDMDGRVVPDGEVGELVFRGPMVMNGFHRRPELNEQRSRWGWHHTNDLGRRESDGTLSFVGPKTRMIKSASENIYPAEVEKCLRAHESVSQVAIIGVPDPVWTQLVVAVVVLAEGATLDEAALIEHCRANIASYKKPRRFVTVDALPRTAGGAVDYDRLDEMFGGDGYPSK